MDHMSFTGRDLGLALSEDVGDAASMRYTADDTADTKSLAPAKPKLDFSRKVLPYRSGKAPVWHQEDEDEGEFLAGSRQASAPAMSEHFLSGLDAAPDGAPPRARPIFQAEVVEAAVDDEGGDDQDDESGGGATLAEPDDESEDEIARRRALLRERLRRKQLEETEEPAEQNEEGPEHEEEEGEEESSSEYETGSEDEVAEPTERLKPIFVPKGRRETVTAAEQQAAEEAAKETKRQLQAEERKRQFSPRSWCRKCEAYKPPRAHHDSVTNRCIVKVRGRAASRTRARTHPRARAVERTPAARARR